MQCGVINDSVSETLDDAMFQDVIATVVKAIDDGITVAEAEDNGNGINVAMVEATTESRSKTSYSTSQESCKIKRLKTSALGTAIIGNSMENTATSPTTKTKSKTCDIDVNQYSQLFIASTIRTSMTR
jgi:hypothetical protein